ncbi:MAG: Shedu anti-phage system protein SduA domain-containing protein [Candidatus Paceibacteria bacterium]
MNNNDFEWKTAGSNFNYEEHLLDVLNDEERSLNKEIDASEVKDGFVSGHAEYLHNGQKKKTIVSAFHVPDERNGGIHHYKIDVYKFKRRGSTYDWKLQSTFREEMKKDQKECLTLDENEIENLKTFLEKQDQIAGLEDTSGKHKVITLKEDENEKSIEAVFDYFLKKEDSELVEVEENKAKIIKELMDRNYDEEIWESMIEEKPELTTRMSLARIYEERKGVIYEYEDKLDQELNEDEWQRLLKNNRWIFGSSFIGRIGEERITTSATLDHPLISEDGYLEIVEIKKPSFPFWKRKSNGDYDKYRGYLQPHPELQGAITQGSNYILEAEKQLDSKDWEEDHDGIAPLKPKCLIVHGRSENWGNEESESFRLLNDRLHGIKIITFDHLLIRAKQTVEFFNPNEQDHE